MRKILLILLLITLCVNTAKSQTSFTPVDTIHEHLCWADQTVKFFDYNNDGYLDILRVNVYGRHLYKNTGNNDFSLVTNIPIFLQNSWGNNQRFRDFGDYDNDGDVDILLKRNSQILTNSLPDSNSYNIENINITNILSAWENIYNYQGKDIIHKIDSFYVLSSFIDSSTIHNKDTIYYSQYLSTINSSYSPPNYNGLSYNYDINNDGFFDIVSSKEILINNGISTNNKFNIISRNTPSSDFTKYKDLDNDGYFDEIFYDYPTNTIIRANDQNGNFVNQFNTGINKSNFYNCECILADYNNDGYIDIVSTKMNNTIYFYKNNGNFNFTLETYINPISYLQMGNMTVGDIDNDGDLDLAVLTGLPDVGVIIYENNITNSNNPPTKPIKLWTTMDSTKIIFHWEHATDVETPQQSLTYNVMVGTSPNGIEIVSPLADTATGFRRVVDIGNAQLNNFFILDKSKFNIGDTLYWRVQTIDNSMGYSEFSKLNTTVICDRMEAPVFDTICSNDSVLWRGNYYSTSGVHNETYGANSCDSTFSLKLAVKPAYLYLEDIDICSNESFSWRGQTYYTSGIHTEHFTTESGCDSIYKLDLSVHHSITTFKNEQLCQGDSIAFANGYLKTPGVYVDSTSTIFGCDSIAHLTLSVSPNDTNIVVQGTKLIGQDFSASYRWLDCDAQLFIPGANKRVFSPFLDGNYAAEISLNGCSYLTKCYSINGTGIRNLESSNIKIFPNPTESFVIIESQNQQISKIALKSIDGKVLKIIEDINSTNQKIDLSSFEKGIYILQIWIEGKVFYYKVVRQ